MWLVRLVELIGSIALNECNSILHMTRTNKAICNTKEEWWNIMRF